MKQKNNKRYQLKRTTLSMFIALGATAVQAQDSNTENSVQEEVVVTGFRQSLETAVDAKRDAGNITDSIYAEDIGKSADQNIAEALSRVTGISINRTDGEGTTISIRGASPNMNNISLNGIQLTTVNNNDAVDLSSFSSDILSSIQVFKTSSADHDEGGLGGTVLLKTFRPLDADEDRRVIEVQGRRQDIAAENDYKISGAFSTKLLDETLGLSATIFKETQSFRRDQVNASGFETLSVPSDTVLDQHGRALTHYDTSLDDAGNPVVQLGTVKGLAVSQLRYESFLNNRDRMGLTFAAQFQPTDETNIQLDVSHSIQNLITDNNYISFNGDKGIPGENQLINHFGIDWERRSFADDDISDLNPELITAFNTGKEAYVDEWLRQNPSSGDKLEQWRTFDTDKGMFTKYLTRYGFGRSGRTTADEENTNTVISLEAEHSIDDLTFSLRLGHSDSESKDNGYFDMNTQNFNLATSVPLWKAAAIDPNASEADKARQIQPTGWDCTSGSCRLVTGSSRVQESELINGLGDTDFNTVYTGFNPDDLNGQHLQQFYIRDRTTTDTANSLFFDVDWEVDVVGFNLIEAGLKYNSREKDIHQVRVLFRNMFINNDDNAVLLFDDPNIAILPDIRLSQVVDKSGFSYSNFLTDLNYPTDNLTDGWPNISAAKAADIIFPAIHLLNDDPDNPTRVGKNYQPTFDPSGDRNITVDSSAIYIKGNFAYLDEKLTGDVGLRYVKTENESNGFSQIAYAGNRQDVQISTVIDNESLPICSASKEFAVRRAAAGQPLTGFDENLTDAELKELDWVVRWHPTDEPRPVQDPAKFEHRNIRDERVRAGEECYDPIVGANTGSEDWRYKPIHVDGVGTKAFVSTGDGSSSVVLPSLNLNYEFTESFIGRLGVSKTMSRPQMDSLQAGFRIAEGGERGGGNIRNPNLKPLESENIDLSFEWYFNDEGGLLSAALFSKSYKNFEEQETSIVAVRDARDQSEEELAGRSAASFLLPNRQGLLITDPAAEGCMLARGNFWEGVESKPIYGYNGTATCGEYRLRNIVNGKGAVVNGMELTYQQHFSSLPGFWSGLGVSMNATLQKTEADKQESAITEGIFLPQFPLARSPEESYNTTFYWEKGGNLVRFAYNYASDVLVNRSFGPGLALWQKGGGTLDISANFELTHWLMLTLNAVNVTSNNRTEYFTSVRNSDLNTVLGLDPETGEGNALDGNADTSRIKLQSTNGPLYRIGLRATF